MGKHKRVGIYLRVSTAEQTVETQRIDLTRVAAQRSGVIVGEYVDRGVSGAKGRDKRPEFARLCKDAAGGKLDMVAAWSIDRIGRSLPHLVELMEEWKNQGVGLYLHQQNVDSSTAAGKAMLSMCGVFAEFERAILVERILAGIARARKQGQRFGRPTIITPAVERRILELRAQGMGKLKISRHLSLGTGTVQRIVGPGTARTAA
jgi:DNA invertase Pin-like site-specific DNA recombinase